MTTTTRLIIVAGGFGALLGAAGLRLATSGGKPEPSVGSVAGPRAEAAPAPDRLHGVTPVLGAAALRAAVREEVRAAIAEETAAARDQQAATAATAAAKPPPESTQSYERAKAHIAERLAQGTWSNADRDRMRDELGTMTDDERFELMKKVVVATNKGQLHLELEGPVF